VLMQTGLLSM